MISFFNNNCDCSSLWSFIPSCPKCNDDGEVRNCEDEGYIRPEDCPECPDCEDLGYIKDPRTEGWIKPEDCLSCEEQGYVRKEDCGSGDILFSYSHSASDEETTNNFINNLIVDCSTLNFSYKANLRNMFKDFGGSLKRLDQLKFNHTENFSNCFENATLLLRPGDPGYGTSAKQYWLDFTNWDMQYATNINNMLKNVIISDYNTRYIDMSGWNLSQLKEINGTFFGINSEHDTYFSTLDLSNWTFPSLTKIDGGEEARYNGFIVLSGAKNNKRNVILDGWDLDNVEINNLIGYGGSVPDVNVSLKGCTEKTIEKVRKDCESKSWIRIVTE